MHNEFTTIIEQDEDWYIAYGPEIPGANGQGKTIGECKDHLVAAIALILAENGRLNCRRTSGFSRNAIKWRTSPVGSLTLKVWLSPFKVSVGGLSR